MYLNTLGVAQYRAGRYAEAIATLDRSLAAGHGQYDGYDLFFQAMAHWQLGDKPQALACFDKAVEWMEKNQQADEELVRFRAEAAALLGVEDKKETDPGGTEGRVPRSHRSARHLRVPDASGFPLSQRRVAAEVLPSAVPTSPGRSVCRALGQRPFQDRRPFSDDRRPHR